MRINDVLDYVNGIDRIVGKNTELEIKVLLDPRIHTPKFVNKKSISESILDIKNIIKNALQYGSPVMSQTINFIHTDTKFMFVKQLIYNNCIQIKDKKCYYTKKSLLAPIYLISDVNPSYKLSVNEETVECNDIDKYDIIRFRNRYSINFINEFKEWRIDLTLIKETKDNSLYNLKNIRDKLFSNDITTDNLLENAIWEYADRIELEIEYVDDLKNIDIYKISQLDKLINISNEHTYKNCICQIASIIKPNILHKFKNGNFGMKQLGSNPVELTKKDYIDNVLPNIKNFILTEKIDGIRTMLILYPKRGECHIINKEYSTMTIPVTDDELIILDTEHYSDKYYVFDVIWYNKDISNLPYTARLEHIKQITLLYNFLQIKHFIVLDNHEQQIPNFYSIVETLDYKTDGLIFISKDKDYNRTLNYKWKPIEKMSIDFVAKKCHAKLLGIFPYTEKPNKTLYILFSGIKSSEYKKLGMNKIHNYNYMFPNIRYNDEYIPIQFEPSDNPYAYLFWSENKELDNMVVELILKNDEWHLIRIRDDRNIDMARKTYYGNYFKYAEYIWLNYKNPLIINDFTIQSNHYFQVDDNKEFTQLRKFNNFVKSQLINLYTKDTDVDWVIDLASGKGQDLYKYIEGGIKNILMIDIDSMALAEIVTRKYKYLTNDSCKISKLFIKQLDLTHPYKKNIEIIEKSYFGLPITGVPLIVCNLALHYLIPNKSKIQNFICLLNKLLKPGGIFIFTSFNGKKVFDLLNIDNNCNVWNSIDNKYSIKKLYADNIFTGINQQISVKLPFSNGQYYTENLINDTILEDALMKKKISINIKCCFNSYFNQYELEKKSHYDQLSESDKQFIELYNFYICCKNTKL